MFQGTGSDVGKSLLVAGLCRALWHRGLKVAPFKPQNMSNNACVTEEGGEIGRAQALQARACKLKPGVHMNPVLLKPQSEIGSQVVVQGKVFGTYAARDYAGLKPKLMDKVLESFQILQNSHDIVLIEGAGSAAEVNLRAGDIANMGFAEKTRTPVVLIGDIERGGVIASLVGTMALLSVSEKSLISGYLINKFRGDVSLFDSAHDIIKQACGLPSFGVVPYFAQARLLPDEDALSLDRRAKEKTAPLKIVVPRLPRIANFDDLDPLRGEPNVEVRIIEAPDPLPQDADLILLAGSKSTICDLNFLKDQGWDVDIQAHLRHQKPVVGICGGFQMLGRTLSDPQGLEGPAGDCDGLGLLDFKTVLEGQKTLIETAGTCLESAQEVRGYEMHMGQTKGPALDHPWLKLNDKPEGARRPDGLVLGTYLHGVFQSDGFRRDFLTSLRADLSFDLRFEAQTEEVLDQLAEHLETHIDMDRLFSL